MKLEEGLDTETKVRIWDYFDWKPFALLEPDLDRCMGWFQSFLPGYYRNLLDFLFVGPISGI